MKFNDYKESLEQINEDKMPRHEETTLVDLFFDFVHQYRRNNNSEHPTHLVVSATTRLDLLKAFHEEYYGQWEMDNDDEPEKLNGMVVSVVSGYHGPYLELV